MYLEPVGIRAVIETRDDTEFSYQYAPEPPWKTFECLGFNSLSTREISESTQESVSQEYKQAFSFDSELQEEFIPEYLVVKPKIREIFYNQECAIFPDNKYENHFIFVGKSKRAVHENIDKFDKRVNEAPRENDSVAMLLSWDYPSEAEISFEVIYGEDYANFLTERLCEPVSIANEFDNHFEQKIYQDIQDEITSCISTNADLFVGSKTNENREYDLLLHISPNSQIYIEAKQILPSIGTNHDNNWKRNLVGKPFEYKAMLHQQAETIKNLKEDRMWNQTECFVVVDSLGSGRFSDFKEMAKDRGINLVEYDDDRKYVRKISQDAKDMLCNFTEPLDNESPYDVMHDNRRKL